MRHANYNPTDPATWSFEVAYFQLPTLPGKAAYICDASKAMLNTCIINKCEELDSPNAILVYRNAVKQVTIISKSMASDRFAGLTQVKNCLFGTKMPGVSMPWEKAIKQMFHEQRELLLQQRPAEVMVLVNYTDSTAKDLFDQVHRYTDPARPTAKPDQFFSQLWQARKQAHFSSLPNTNADFKIAEWQPVDPEITGSKIFDPFEL